jgi:hypothetical protein
MGMKQKMIYCVALKFVYRRELSHFWPFGFHLKWWIGLSKHELKLNFVSTFEEGPPAQNFIESS